MKERVLAGKILVEQDKKEEVTKGGIIIPDTAKKKPRRGTVVTVGDSTKNAQMDLKKGDRVMFSDDVGTTILIDEPEFSLKGEYILLDQNQVLIFKTK
jgi:chaperonin GroES